MKRVYNFAAGPSMLPLEVLEKVQTDLLDYNGCGMSVMEMSHRSKTYQAIIDEAESDLRKLLNIPSNYKVLFLQGGASSVFSSIPLNLMKGKADYIISGLFSKRAATEAKKYGEVHVLADGIETNYQKIPYVDSFDSDASYVHICFNNTVYGTTYNYIPNTGNIPLVADMSSCILSTPIDVNKFGLIYAGAQKNIGPAGFTIVIVREDLIGSALDITPTMFDYKIQADNGSMYNTPPCFAIYVAGLVFKHLLSLGGLEEVKENNIKKAKLLYDYLDNSKLFIPVADKDSRSLMNVTFRTGSEEMDNLFVQEAAKRGLVSLKGHRLVKGIRASIYNAMPLSGVEALVSFMKEFEEKYV